MGNMKIIKDITAKDKVQLTQPEDLFLSIPKLGKTFVHSLREGINILSILPIQ